MRKSIIVTCIVGSVFLGGCTQQKTTESTEESTVIKDNQGNSVLPETTETTSSMMTSESTTTNSREVTGATMNFTEIKSGNYHSLIGEWHEIAYGYNAKDGNGYQQFAGGEEEIQITPTTISAAGIILEKDSLKVGNDTHKLTFTEDNNILRAEISESVPINWGMTFYPAGTTEEFKLQPEDTTNTVNIITVWTSNNSSQQIFAQTTEDSCLLYTSPSPRDA